MASTFDAGRDSFIAYAETGAATVNIGTGAATALPGPVFVGVPDLPDNYRPRESDFAALKAMLLEGGQDTGIVGRSRSAGLRGMGGVGKTVLATALTHDPDVRAAFTYGIVWLGFGRGADGLARISVFSRAVTGRAPGYTTTAEARVDLARLLADRRLLLVLDDVWEPDLVDGFRSLSPGCHLLVTTRQYSVIERARARAREVGLLDGPASRALFGDAVGVEDLPGEADGIIRECGGLPLALAAAAGMVRRSGWAHTRDAFSRARLDAVKTPWLPDSEQRNLEIVLAASVDALPARERACFLECAVWPEDVSVPMSALGLFWAAHAPDSFDQREIAEALVAASVLQRDGAETVRLHDLYHDFLRHVAGTGLAELHGALADRCARFGEAGPELLDGSAWVLAHLPWHLVQAGRLDDAKALLFDFEWLAAKFAALGAQALIGDTKLFQDTEVERLGRVLRLSSHVLAGDATQFAPQLVGRLREESSPGTERLTGAAWRNVPPTVLVPRDGKHLVEPGALSATFAGHASTVNGALLLPDGRRALSWSSDHTLRVWDLENGQGRPLEGHSRSVNGALLLPDGRRALSWSWDNTLRVWDLETGQGRPLEGHSRWVNGALLLPDGRRALSWSGDNILRVWDLESGQGRPLEGHNGLIQGALLLPDGRRALSWSWDKTLRLWDLDSGQGRPLEGHDELVTGALLLPDGRRALS